LKYATWQLDFTNPDFGTGPESLIVEQGGTAEGAIANGGINDGAEILGYFTGEPTGLEAWSFSEITQSEALFFAKAINESAYVDDNGRIIIDFVS